MTYFGTTKEKQVYLAVMDGRLHIDYQGRIWRGGRRAEKPKGGYLRITLRIHGKITNTLAHRLVYLHFFGTIPLGYVVNHIDGDGYNNSPDNLEAVTPSENLRHAYRVLKRGGLNREARERGNETQHMERMARR